MTPVTGRLTLALMLPLASLAAGDARADQLYTGNSWASIASDAKARAVGDIVTVQIFEAASASNRVRNRSSKETTFSGQVGAGSFDEQASLRLRGGYDGSGEVERSDRLAATMAAQVIEVLPNGDLMIEGRQDILVNGEARAITVRGRVRQLDISDDNTIASSRLAGAQINYDGKGFATRSAKPGIINQLFSLLGLG